MTGKKLSDERSGKLFVIMRGWMPCGFQNRTLFHVRGTRKCGILTEEVLKMGNAAKGI